MSILFTPIKLGNLEIKNRIIRAATVEAMATPDGAVTEKYLSHYRQLANGGVGLCITGSFFVHPSGKPNRTTAGIHEDQMIPGLKNAVTAVHDAGGKIAFQLSHTGRQSNPKIIGQMPMSPSAMPKDPMYSTKSRAMTKTEIRELIDSFVQAAGRAVEAGADAVEIMAGHGYLVNEFLSPFYNRRRDEWGGSAENQFRFLKEIICEIQKIKAEFPVIVKLNTNDYTPSLGITLPLAVQYAGWLKDLGIAALEITSGTASYSFMNSYRGDVPVAELVGTMPAWKRPLARLMITKQLVGKYPCNGEYHLEAAGVIKPVLGEIPLILVGGIRNRRRMEEILEQKQADALSICRPLIREPHLVNKMKEGAAETATCTSCNKCLIHVALYDHPVACYAGK